MNVLAAKNKHLMTASLLRLLKPSTKYFTADRCNW